MPKKFKNGKCLVYFTKISYHMDGGGGARASPKERASASDV